MIGLLSPDEIEGLLKRHRVGRLGICLEDRPYVVPINYAYDGATISVASGPGQKIDAMRARPRVCLQVDEIDASGAWRSAIADGMYEELTDGDARRSALARLGPTWAGHADSGLALSPAIVVFRIRVTGKTGRFGRKDVRSLRCDTRSPEVLAPPAFVPAPGSPNHQAPEARLLDAASLPAGRIVLVETSE